MTDESYSFTAAKTRLDEIVTQVRKKDTSLEKSLDLLEEGVRLANVCTELIDHADWATAPSVVAAPAADTGASGEESAPVAEQVVDAERGESDGSDAVDEVGEVWSEDEAWADDSDSDPSDGDDGHGV